MIERAAIGAILGCAVGDAMGLPMEGMTPRRQARLFPSLEGHHFLFGRGMVSDDTEHTLMSAQALIQSGGDPELFAVLLARKLRWWLLALPSGAGPTTLRATARLWMGYPPGASAVWSASNGPAMRAPVIGAAFGADRALMARLVKASVTITNSDPRAFHGALACALAAAMAAETGTAKRVPARRFVDELGTLLAGEPAGEFMALMEHMAEAEREGIAVADFAASLGLSRRGPGGYIFHTAPAALYAWLANQWDVKNAVTQAIRLGGDTDTIAAITGAITAAGTGEEGIPSEWLERLFEWPRSVAHMKAVGRRLAQVSEAGKAGLPVHLFTPVLPLRNLFFLLVVLVHGLRRLAPPY
ncbi:MAG: ADP-ribosylglycohydrolase family protein [Nitrospinae bacterium]|nr:ADP-ribosylglycohydrolase family protein [Nitrospinota bacterium]